MGKSKVMLFMRDLAVMDVLRLLSKAIATLAKNVKILITVSFATKMASMQKKDTASP